jgi:hypothetical protein
LGFMTTAPPPRFCHDFFSFCHPSPYRKKKITLPPLRSSSSILSYGVLTVSLQNQEIFWSWSISFVRRTFAFCSGIAAISIVTQLLKSGDVIIAGGDIYGGTVRLLSTVSPVPVFSSGNFQSTTLFFRSIRENRSQLFFHLSFEFAKSCCWDHKFLSPCNSKSFDGILSELR